MRNPKSDDKEAPKTFTFDQVYDQNCSQVEIFDITARPIVDSAMEGYNGGYTLQAVHMPHAQHAG